MAYPNRSGELPPPSNHDERIRPSSPPCAASSTARLLTARSRVTSLTVLGAACHQLQQLPQPRVSCFSSQQARARPSSQHSRGLSKPFGRPPPIRDERDRLSRLTCAASTAVRVPRSSHPIMASLSVTRAARHQRQKHPTAKSVVLRVRASDQPVKATRRPTANP